MELKSPYGNTLLITRAAGSKQQGCVAVMR